LKKAPIKPLKDMFQIDLITNELALAGGTSLA
jgi:hypothetical protein